MIVFYIKKENFNNFYEDIGTYLPNNTEVYYKSKPNRKDFFDIF